MINNNWIKLEKKLLLIGIILISLVSLIFLVNALTSEEETSLQSELDNLTSFLSDLGYDWLINYDINANNCGINGSILGCGMGRVNVYREGDNRVLTSFESIFEEGWYKVYLSSLNENESYSTFDLRSFGDVERINYNILQKKMRIDEIRKELNQEGGNS